MRRVLRPLAPLLCPGLLASGCAPSDGLNIEDGYGMESACDLDSWGPELEIAYVLDYAENAVHVVNPRMCRQFTTIPVGDRPVVANASPSGGRVFVGNRGSRSVSIIDTDENRVIETLALDFAPEGLRFDPAHRFMWIVGEGRAARYNIVTEQLVDTIEHQGGVPVTAVTTTEVDRVYLGVPGSTSLVARQAPSAGFLAEVQLGAPLAHFDYAATTSNVYACTDDASLVRIPTEGVVTDVVVGAIPLEAPCDRVTIDRAGDLGIALHGVSGRATVFDVSDNTVVDVLDLGGHPDEVIFRTDVALIGNRGTGELGVFSLGSRSLADTLSVGSPVPSWSLNRENRRSVHADHAYFVNPEDGTLTVIDVEAGAVRGSIEVGTQPISVIIAGPVGGTCC